MKCKVFFILAAVLFVFATSGTLKAQSQEQIDKFNKERKDYFTDKLELSESESKAFWPLYEDFSNRKMKLVEDERNTWTYAHKNADNLSDEEILETLGKSHDLKVKELELEKEYYQGKFLKALPAKKVLKLGKVEWDFRRYLLRKLREEGSDNRGQGGRSSRRSDGAGPSDDGAETSPLGPSPYLF